MKASWSIRDWVYVGLFGALWGVLELSLGSVLHVLFPPLSNTFFVGLIMASLGCIIALTGRHFVPHRGSIVLIGVITALLKALSLGGVKIGPIVAILAESLLMELALLAGAGANRLLYLIAGVLALSWNFFHRFIMLRLIFGKRVVEVGLKMARDGSKLLSIDERFILLILLILLLIRIAAGAVSGWVAWELGGRVQRRLASRHGE